MMARISIVCQCTGTFRGSSSRIESGSVSSYFPGTMSLLVFDEIISIDRFKGDELVLLKLYILNL